MAEYIRTIKGSIEIDTNKTTHTEHFESESTGVLLEEMREFLASRDLFPLSEDGGMGVIMREGSPHVLVHKQLWDNVSHRSDRMVAAEQALAQAQQTLTGTRKWSKDVGQCPRCRDRMRAEMTIEVQVKMEGILWTHDAPKPTVPLSITILDAVIHHECDPESDEEDDEEDEM